ncbi:MAG: phosphoribosylglycinamide formyltransferase [Cytophagaceae bacterium]|jgi:phosphoribosylglycinamide formyltransferase-1|nr:phosphoribosylglycinamide formyltransferase [Cytophagaceae bacterium]
MQASATQNIALFASGSGTNVQAIAEYFKDRTDVRIVLIATNNPNAYVIERAKNLNIPCTVFTRADFYDSSLLVEELKQLKVDWVILAGFLWLIPSYFVQAFPNMLNIHPALLPSFGGKGMYGMKVHEAVKATGAVSTGITIHRVNEQYDEGAIVFQASCPVAPEDTPETIAAKVHALEYAHYARIIDEQIQQSRISI